MFVIFVLAGVFKFIYCNLSTIMSIYVHIIIIIGLYVERELTRDAPRVSSSRCVFARVHVECKVCFQ